MKKKQGEFTAIIMLLFALATIFVIMYHMRKLNPRSVNEMCHLKSGERIAVLDSVYVNLPLSFALFRPNRLWNFNILARDSLFPNINGSNSIFQQIAWQLELSQQDGIAFSRIGLLRFARDTELKDCAIFLLADIIEQFENKNNRIRLLTEVTTSEQLALPGAYFVLVLPQSANEVFPLWIVTILKRDENCFIILSQTDEKKYVQLRDDFKNIIANFRPLPAENL